MRDFTHIDDIVDALQQIMVRDAYGYDFELGRGKNYSVNEVANMFKIKPKYCPPRLGESRNTLCKSQLAKEILEWKPKRNLFDYIKNKEWEKI